MIIQTISKTYLNQLKNTEKKVFLIFFFKNDSDLLEECELLKSGINRLSLEFENVQFEQNEDYLDHIIK